MRIIILLLACCFIAGVALHAQTQQQKNDAAFQLVKKYMNEHQADSIYNMAGGQFRAAVSRDAFVNIANNQLFPLGDIQRATLLRYKDGVNDYKLSFKELDLELLLSVDDKNKLQAFLFREYKEPVAGKSYTVPTTNKMETALDKQVDSFARAYIQQQNTVGLSIGVLQHGKMIAYYYGETKRDNKTLPDDNTLYEIGSITKTFTATLLAYYVVKHKVALTDPITKYLPDSVKANKDLRGITLVMLSNHTSGLPSLPDNFEDNMTDSLNPYRNYSKAQMFSYLRHYKQQTPPGSKYGYSNFAVGLLGVILEQVSGMPYEQMVTAIICKPLHMDNTAGSLDDEMQQRLTTVYNESGSETPAWSFDAIAGAGCLHSTVPDLLQYARANMANGNSDLHKAMALTHQITNTKTINVGLGWHESKGRNNYLWHNGGTYGSSSFLAFDAKKGVAVVVLSNCGASADEVGVNLMTVLQ